MRELDRNAGGGDALQRGAVQIGALDRVDFKIKADNRVGAIFLRFADQSPDGGQTVRFHGEGIGGPPTGGRLDAADRIMAAAAFELMSVTDLHYSYRFPFTPPACPEAVLRACSYAELNSGTN